MKKILLLLLALTITICGGCYYELKYGKVKKMEEKSGFERTFIGDSFIRNKPITNREYIIFLVWNIEVFGDEFPDYVSKLIPHRQSDDTLSQKEGIFEILIANEEYLKEYILNTNYIDYPVTGLNLFQLGEMYLWMSDRYAENKLVKLRHLTHNFAQYNEDNFSLDAFICSQYMGDVFTGFKPKLSDNIFIPNFRPPFLREEYYSKNAWRQSEKKQIWKPYKMEKNDFLWTWNELYIQDNKVVFPLITNQAPLLLSGLKKTANYENHTRTFYLKNKKEFYSSVKYIESMAGIEKDEYGKMPYIYTGHNLYGRPIVIDKYKFEADAVSEPNNAFYWLVYSDEIESLYWPVDAD